MSLLTEERAKYRKAWAIDDYRKFSPGEAVLPLFRDMVRKREGTLLDLGCGTGRAGLALSGMGFDTTLADFVGDACLDDDVAATALPFSRINAWGRWPSAVYDWIYCCDMLEHLPPEKVGQALDNIARHARQAFLSIHFGPDNFGRVVGHPLHLTQRPYAWWREALRKRGDVVDARDLLGMGVYRVKFAHA